jgi:hypothetical protein
MGRWGVRWCIAAYCTTNAQTPGILYAKQGNFLPHPIGKHGNITNHPTKSDLPRQQCVTPWQLLRVGGNRAICGLPKALHCPSSHYHSFHIFTRLNRQHASVLLHRNFKHFFFLCLV